MPTVKLPPPPRKDSVVITVRMPLSLVKQLDKAAAREQRTRSALVAIAAQRYVEKAA